MSQADLKLQAVLKESRAKQICHFTGGASMSISQIHYSSHSYKGASVCKPRPIGRISRLANVNS